VMETRFYGAIGSARVVPPGGEDLDRVHDAYVAMAAAGVVTAGQRSVFYEAGRRLIREEGVEAILLGGTDLALAFDGASGEFPVVDCAGIHVDAVAKAGLG